MNIANVFAQRRRFLFFSGIAALFPSQLLSDAQQEPLKKNTVRLEKWQCTNQDCEPYIYDPSVGDVNVIDPDNPIPPGVPFEDLPDNWICPTCADPKRFFVPAGQWVEVEIVDL